jgi:hypothetical protein
MHWAGGRVPLATLHLCAADLCFAVCCSSSSGGFVCGLVLFGRAVPALMLDGHVWCRVVHKLHPGCYGAVSVEQGGWRGTVQEVSPRKGNPALQPPCGTACMFCSWIYAHC